MAKLDVRCPVCGGTKVIKYGISDSGKKRYYCKDTACTGKSFQIEHCYTGCKPGINDKIENIVTENGFSNFWKVRKTLSLRLPKVYANATLV